LSGASKGVTWFRPPRVDVDAYKFNEGELLLFFPGQKMIEVDLTIVLGIGTGFASLIRDANGAWWHRPYPWRAIHYSANAGVARVEVAMAHLRDGAPCIVKDDLLELMDASSASLGAATTNVWQARLKQECPSFRFK